VAVIGRRAWQVCREEAMDFVWGCTCGNDVTARDLQRTDGQWTRAKGFDTFCPLGPRIVSDLDVSDLRIRCLVNVGFRGSRHCLTLLASWGASCVSLSSHAGIRGFAQKHILCYNLANTIPSSGEDRWRTISRLMKRQ
jgi:2-keto-4-pentenoate hydratase/2-oxohepta-3-ene-1,7-dioic acid hydratase in catechol pathway